MVHAVLIEVEPQLSVAPSTCATLNTLVVSDEARCDDRVVPGRARGGVTLRQVAVELDKGAALALADLRTERGPFSVARPARIEIAVFLRGAPKCQDFKAAIGVVRCWRCAGVDRSHAKVGSKCRPVRPQSAAKWWR